MMKEKSIQDQTPEGICWGCGPANAEGFQIKSFWEGEEVVCFWQPEGKHRSVGDFVNGGALATVLDCHMGVAASSAMSRWLKPGHTGENLVTCLTANLNLDYLAPTPMTELLELRATIEEMTEKKVIIKASLLAGKKLTVRATGVFVRVAG